MKQYADVAEAVKAGQLGSGGDHYMKFGFRENRFYRDSNRLPPPKPAEVGPGSLLREKLLCGLNLSDMQGLEIGPLASPMIRKIEGDIFYVDYTSTESLRRTYASDPHVLVDDIVEIDAEWGSKDLAECVGPDLRFDYAVASHVVEHIPDLVSWLQEVSSVLKLGGQLRLVVPDRRYTFDYLRLETRAHDVLDAYVQKTRVPLPRLVIEFISLARRVDCRAAWDGQLVPDLLEPLNTVENGIRAAEDVFMNKTYYDTHCWVFTPESFIKLGYDLSLIGLMGFKLERVYLTEKYSLEFVVHLVACHDREACTQSWKEFLVTSPV